MGITEFGRKSKQFDINEQIKAARMNAKPVSRFPEAKLSEESVKTTDGEAEEGDDMIGPVPTIENSEDSRIKKKKEKKKRDYDDDDDDDSDEDSSDDEDGEVEERDKEESVAYRIPASHEVQMAHGSKAITALASGLLFIL